MARARKLVRRIEDVRSGRFLTFSCDGRRPLLDPEDVRDRFVERLELVARVMPFELYEWVVMKNHVHLLGRVTQEGVTMAEVLARLKAQFAKAELQNLRASGVICRHFWLPGGGYDRNIYSMDEFEEKRRYIINNPVSAGYVARAEDWRWSSVGWPARFWHDPYHG